MSEGSGPKKPLPCDYLPPGSADVFYLAEVLDRIQAEEICVKRPGLQALRLAHSTVAKTTS